MDSGDDSDPGFDCLSGWVMEKSSRRRLPAQNCRRKPSRMRKTETSWWPLMLVVTPPLTSLSNCRGGLWWWWPWNRLEQKRASPAPPPLLVPPYAPQLHHRWGLSRRSTCLLTWICPAYPVPWWMMDSCEYMHLWPGSRSVRSTSCPSGLGHRWNFPLPRTRQRGSTQTNGHMAHNLHFWIRTYFFVSTYKYTHFH